MSNSLCHWRPSDVPVFRLFYASSGFDPEKNGGWESFRQVVQKHLENLRVSIDEVGGVLNRVGIACDCELAQGYYEVINKIDPVLSVGRFVRVGLHRVADGDRIAVIAYPHNVDATMHIDLDDMPDVAFAGHYGVGKKAVFEMVSAVDGLLLSYLQNSLRLVSSGLAARRTGDHFVSEIRLDQVEDFEVYLGKLHGLLNKGAHENLSKFAHKTGRASRHSRIEVRP